MITYPPEFLPGPDEDDIVEIIVNGRVMFRKEPRRPMVRISDFDSEDAGSNPAEAANALGRVV